MESSGGSSSQQPHKRFRRGARIPAEQGPIDIVATMSWPDWLVTSLQHDKPDLLRQYVKQHRLGIDLYTQFSGLGGPEIGLELLQQALAAHGCVKSGDQGLLVCEAGDWDAIPQKVLMGLSAPARAKHIFVDICDRLPSDVKGLMDAAAPEKGMEPDAMQACFEAMQCVLESNYDRCFNAGHCAPCLAHGRGCPLYDEQQSDRAEALRVMWGGPPCLDDTIMGNRAGHFGPQSKHFLIWLMELKKGHFDISVHEGSPGFLPALISDVLGDGFQAARFHSSLLLDLLCTYVSTLSAQLACWKLTAYRRSVASFGKLHIVALTVASSMRGHPIWRATIDYGVCIIRSTTLHISVNVCVCVHVCVSACVRVCLSA
jgi:hypothetical protein